MYYYQERGVYKTERHPATSSGTSNLLTHHDSREFPFRTYNQPFPAHVAFISNGQLMLLNGTKAGEAPVRVANSYDSIYKIVGWSYDGKWLLYLQMPSSEYENSYYLWVAKADGSQSYKIDDNLVSGTPAWSPVDNYIAYTARGSNGSGNNDDLKIALVGENKARVIDLHAENVMDYDWAPDGKSLAVSYFPETENPPFYFDRITLQGDRTRLFTSGVPDGLKWSPDGRYLACFFYPFSASLAADGAPIRVIDLKYSPKNLDLGNGNKDNIGLIYKEWLAWSPDGKQLAYISGGGREATSNKHLFIANISNGTIRDFGRNGEVDVQPVWSSQRPFSLVLCRGTETNWDEQQNISEVPVPGQRIDRINPDGTIRTLTYGSETTQDCTPSISNDGKYITFLRLNHRNEGSLYMMSLAGGTETELINNISVDAGFYGNYLPSSVSIYWQE